MLKNNMLILIFISLLSWSVSIFADIAVIVHPSNSSTLDEKTVSDIFLAKKKSFSDGTSAVPLNVPQDDPARSLFEEKVLNKSSSQVKAYWSKLVFTGKGVPPDELSQTEVKKFVSENPTAIGYIDSAAVDSSVKSVLKVAAQ